MLYLYISKVLISSDKDMTFFSNQKFGSSKKCQDSFFVRGYFLDFLSGSIKNRHKQENIWDKSV